MNLSEREKKFENFLNKTIILSSKKFYKEECYLKNKEYSILDDENFDDYINKYTKVEKESNCNNIIDFINELDNIKLIKAIESLSDIEKTVIFLLYERKLTSSEASKMLKICLGSISRIKKRVIKKLQDYMKGAE